MSTSFNIISTVGKAIFPSLLWNFNSEEKTIYLTFDDGPVPGMTPWVLQKLKEYNAKATFFCIGDNVDKSPEILEMIWKDGHVIGNHSYNHLNGWKIECREYIKNVVKAEAVINKLRPLHQKGSPSQSGKKLFRPPYGRIKLSQIRALQNRNYEIVMWDVISGDYDQNKPFDSCLKEVFKNTKPGSILVFHDSHKAFKNLERILPEILSHYKEKGFEFKTL